MSEGGYIYHFPRVKLRKDKTNPRRIAYVFLLLFAMPPSWPAMAIGTALVLAGIAFHGWAAGYLARAGYEDRETVLTLLGPYRHNRNPYYVAHLTMDLGFFCVAGLAPFYLLYFPILFAVYRRWVLNEEPFLRQAFGAEYEQMCKEVPRWGIRLTPAAPRGPDQRFTWSMYFFNGEHWRSGSHLIWLAVFWLIWAWGNPFGSLPVLVPATIAGVIAPYYIVHDVTPRDVSRLSWGWLLLALAIAAGGATFLASAAVWNVWPAPWVWLGRGLGLLLGILLPFLLQSSRRRAEHGRESQRGAMVAWYVAALALGLLSCTFGGIWLAVVACLTIWALSIAGIAAVTEPSPTVPATVLWVLIVAASLGGSFFLA